MRLSKIGELSLLDVIRSKFAGGARDVIAGIGDDAAVVLPRDMPLLLTSDMMTEGIHFDLRFTTWFQVGYKIVSVNVSDIYAMGGIPRFMLLNLAANENTDDRCIGCLLEGVRKALGAYLVRLVGGDLSSSKSGMTLSATLIGYAKKPVMRSGASPGDLVYVTGTLGDSACGLNLLKRIGRPLSIETGERTDYPLGWKTAGPVLVRHLLPEARKPGRITKVATAMIDVSDGLLMDLSRLCEESKVGTRIYMKRLPLSSQMRKIASELKIDPYTLATSGGEDYELLFTAPPHRKVEAVCIGEITRSGRVIIETDGSKRTFSPEGYQHWH
ncbi:MAG TPA: thiamine-phosphate kinase [Thermodesulfovibrionales bacterium]|nr:thiamine-phosphate kinase [Thermodesulfovibrionales bacterium]